MSSQNKDAIDETESDYGIEEDVDVDMDIDDNDQDDVEMNNNKNDDDDIDDNDHEDDDDEEDEDINVDHNKPKKLHHMYHQIQESTEIRIVAPDKRITSEYMTIYEYSMVVGTRAMHISSGAVLYTDPDGLSDPMEIAKKEINENRCPLSINRKISPTAIEIWEVNEMIKPQL